MPPYPGSNIKQQNYCLISNRTTKIFCLQANNTYSQNATVNLNLENVSLTDVFREIEKQSDYRFFFNSAVLSAVKKQNIKTGEKSITSVLDQLFEGTDIGYKFKERRCK